MSVAFLKLVGAGNDFIFLSATDIPQNMKRNELAKQLCHRQLGIGADGLVLMEKTEEPEAPYRWDFYNSDGSAAEMCGNAARCAVLYSHIVYKTDELIFATAVGPVQGRWSPHQVEVTWTLNSDQMAEVSIDLENFKTVTGHFVNTGVPHFVISNEVTKITKKECAEIQRHPRFGPAQTNVTLLESDDQEVHHTKTFERGVRDFTLACGTGVIASAFVLQKQNKQDVYDLKAPGGDLQVRLSGPTVTLIGPARFVFKGEVQTGGLNV